MRDDLLSYYERELSYLRHQGTDFARRYPKIASRLEIDPARCEDPHVERLLEAFAFLSARVHLKLDDEFPEIAQALMNVVCPHILRPLPSMTVVQFDAGSHGGEVTTATECPKGHMLSVRLPSGGTCQFQTAYPLTVWPLRVTKARWTTPDRLPAATRVHKAAQALHVVIECQPGSHLGDLPLDTLRLFLNGTAGVTFSLHEALLNRCLRVHVRPVADEGLAHPWIMLGPNCLKAVGLDPRETILPSAKRAFSGYQVLHEYFAYPEKHLFVDWTGLDPLRRYANSTAFEVVVSMAAGEPAGWDQAIAAGLNEETLLLNCTPAVNLFPVTADPITLEGSRYEYPLVPDVRRRQDLAVFSIERVTGTEPRTGDPREFSAFHSLHHRYRGDPAAPDLYWQATRRNLQDAASGSSAWLTFHDVSGKRRLPQVDTVTVRCLCSNGDLPERFAVGGSGIDLDGATTGVLGRARLLRKPTPYRDPNLDGGLPWRLVSHLSLNAQSLAESPEPLREMLRLYGWLSPDAPRQIEGLHGLSSARRFSRVVSEEGIAFARGLAVDVEIDEEAFVGGSAYLFTSVLEQFFSMYVSVNSFTQLTARSRQRKEPLRTWPARTGSTILL